jgi:hypothetical protein
VAHGVARIEAWRHLEVAVARIRCSGAPLVRLGHDGLAAARDAVVERPLLFILG